MEKFELRQEQGKYYMSQKQPIWRSPKYTQAAKGQSCVRCGKDDGTIVGAHYTGFRQHAYGKGRGIKGSDITIADLCYDCHYYFDNPDEYKSVDRSEEFQHCVLLTIIRRLAAGVLKT